ncbi:MAG: LicD family protein [Bacillales bacterium]|jgi:lipopolysaccharide cholinephosphotransferase|nr:LicD family protein [Bacillales bacterium]
MRLEKIIDGKKLLVEMLIHFDDICKKNNIKYSIGYGTFLGAIRHEGFIPWDDDIDVMMTRDNYDKLISLHFISENEEVFHYSYTKGYYYQFAKFVRTDTILKEKNRRENNMGLYIDIFPIDLLTEEYLKKTNKKLLWLKKKILFIGSKKKEIFKANFLTCIFKSIVFFDSFLFSHTKYLVKYDKIIRKCENGNILVNMVLTSYSCQNSQMPCNLFDSYSSYLFENEAFAGIENFHSYLSIIYGDYMKLPPISERKNHNINCYYKNK